MHTPKELLARGVRVDQMAVTRGKAEWKAQYFVFLDLMLTGGEATRKIMEEMEEKWKR